MLPRLSAAGRIASFALTVCAIAMPAHANSSAADAFQIDDQLEGSEKIITPLGEADANFKQMFDVWSGRATAGKPQLEVSVPSIEPVSGYRLTSYFGNRSDPFSGGRGNHHGIDMAAPTGTPIYATADGLIERAGWVNGYGNFIEIEHGNQVETRYGHLSRLNVESYQRVKKGDLIGYVGSTGRSTGPHLHYEVRIAGKPVNPLSFMNQMNGTLLADNSGATDDIGGPND
ncbi:M23 family metallopeptidase [Novosphingopyxis iocasae]|nr:M23 family metallopeptidase [Novosphingopyxis iocasae]MBH9538370.1 M23 family metallopeptidase [Novosphingopyxis sp. YJ-S2-01]